MAIYITIFLFCLDVLNIKMHIEYINTCKKVIAYAVLDLENTIKIKRYTLIKANNIFRLLVFSVYI